MIELWVIILREINFPYLNIRLGKERGDSAPLLCSGETSSGILRSAPEPSAQEGHGTVGAGPKEGYKNDPRAGALLL